ncbi:transporter substrate-binding protein [Roseateles sp. BYS87W]|uniref:Transporter substrate-binding protein n=1 Tax=Pelomonas baiyunensis TaxID=3299026 RepID=A0ABW7GXH8_9BURK
MKPGLARWTRWGSLLLVLVLLASLAVQVLRPGATRAPIVIGLLLARSGQALPQDAPLAAATRRVVAELNASGGLLGRPVQLLEEDTQGDARRAASAAQRLIREQGAVALFGCGSAECRDAVRPVVEGLGHLLFYPLAHEGLSISPHIVYTGALPNQQVLPALSWAMERFGPRVFVSAVGDVEGERLRQVLQEFVRLRGGQWTGAVVVAPGQRDFEPAILAAQRARPDVVVSLLRGTAHRQWVDQSLAMQLGGVPLLALRAREADLRGQDGGRMREQFTAWSYLSAPAGEPPGTGSDDEAASAALAVQLWAAAVRDGGSVRTDAVAAHVLLQSVPGPQGVAALDARSRHLWRALRIAQVAPDGGLDEVAHWPRYIRPEPWPSFRSVDAWRALLASPQRGAP